MRSPCGILLRESPISRLRLSPAVVGGELGRDERGWIGLTVGANAAGANSTMKPATAGSHV